MDLLNELSIKSKERQHIFADGQNHNEWSLPEWGNALAGEVGELCNVIKKIHRGDYTLEDANDKDLLADEAADILIYLDLLCQKAGLNLGRALVTKFNKSSDKLNAPHIKIGTYKEKHKRLSPLFGLENLEPLRRLEDGKEYVVIVDGNFKAGDRVIAEGDVTINGTYWVNDSRNEDNESGYGCYILPSELAEIPEEPQTYVKLSLRGFGSYIDTIEGLKSFVDTIEEWEEDAVYSFSAIKMTKTEFNNLPEFEGF